MNYYHEKCSECEREGVTRSEDKLPEVLKKCQWCSGGPAHLKPMAKDFVETAQLLGPCLFFWLWQVYKVEGKMDWAHPGGPQGHASDALRTFSETFLEVNRTADVARLMFGRGKHGH